MIEILRRLALAVGTFLGLWLIVQTPPVLYRVRPTDWNAERDRIQRRGEGVKETMAGLVPDEDLQGIDLAPETRGSLQELIVKQTEGRTTRVTSPAWQGFFNAVAETVSGSPPSPAWRARMGRSFADEELFFRPDEGPLPELAPVFAGEAMFRYVQVSGADGTQYLAVTKVETGDALGTAPLSLLYPNRTWGFGLLAATLLVYALLPWPKLAGESMRYSRARSAVIPDMMAAFMGGIFFVLPAFIIDANGYGAGLFSPGWVFLTLGMWLMAAIMAVIWPFAARYTATSAEWLDGRLILRDLGRTATVGPGEIERIQTSWIDRSKVKRALIFLSLFSWRAMGPALLASEGETALHVVLRDGRVFSFGLTALLGAPQMVGRLSRAGVEVDPDVYEQLEIKPDSPELSAPFPPPGKGVASALVLVLAVVPLGALALSTRPSDPPTFADGEVSAMPYRSTKEKAWVPSPALMRLERETLARMTSLKGRMNELEQRVKSTAGEERAAALKEFNACFEEIRRLSDDLDRARADEGAPK
ncbi:MAG: hypothetical protein H6534_02225 [Chthonomonadaceae bacterium]|nr:hypothetical protein [Chthonomonadaceae bacterium]